MHYSRVGMTGVDDTHAACEVEVLIAVCRRYYRASAVKNL
jgi:hypothetical protein